MSPSRIGLREPVTVTSSSRLAGPEPADGARAEAGVRAGVKAGAEEGADEEDADAEEDADCAKAVAASASGVRTSSERAVARARETNGSMRTDQRRVQGPAHPQDV
jgi:hypothetical protein